MKITVGVSARHVHLTKEVYQKLFGEETLTPLRTLDQPTQFASTSLVTIKNADQEIKNVRVLGPFRKYNQVEISQTDAHKLKTNPPVRSSGQIKNTETITIIGPLGKITLPYGLIIANRHIHLTEEDIKKYNLENVEKVKIKITGDRGGILDNVYLKPSEDANLRLHIDTDDAGAFQIKEGDKVEVIIERGK